MKHKELTAFALLLLACIIVCLLLTGCGTTPVEDQETSPASMFVIVEHTSGWKVVYHRETKVMYTVSWSGYNLGNFTVMVNPDGSPMLWEE